MHAEISKQRLISPSKAHLLDQGNQISKFDIASSGSSVLLDP